MTLAEKVLAVAAGHQPQPRRAFETTTLTIATAARRATLTAREEVAARTRSQTTRESAKFQRLGRYFLGMSVLMVPKYVTILCSTTVPSNK